ncbi:MAG: hypothetical protein ABIH35_00165 [Patescibacteria group bacterium]
MNGKKLLTIISSVIIGFGVLAITLSYLSSQEEPIAVNLEPVFVSAADAQEAVVQPGSMIAEKGSLEFGDLAIFQLTGAESILDFGGVEFAEDTEAVTSAQGWVNSGSVLAISLIFGAELTLADERVTAINRGGSFVFEKGTDSTRVRGLSGTTKLRIALAGGTDAFEVALTTGQESLLTDEVISNIINTTDPIQRVAVWQATIGEFESRFEGESRMLSKLLEQLPSGEVGFIRKAFRWFKEKVLFTPVARENFYALELQNELAKAAAGDLQAVSSYLAMEDVQKRQDLKKIVARAIPLTRLTIAESLTPSSKQLITQLAELSSFLAQFAEVADLPETIQLNRSLIFIADNPGDAKQVGLFLDRVKRISDPDQAENAALLLTLLLSEDQFAEPEWLEAYHFVNRAQIVSDSDLAFAIVDQLTLATALINKGHEELGSKALQELVSLLAEASKRLPAASLEGIATRGNDLKNRLLFLSSDQGGILFDEEAYATWLAEQKAAAAESEVEPETAEAPDDGRVARPWSELSKFLNLLEVEVPARPTGEEAIEAPGGEGTTGAVTRAETPPAETDGTSEAPPAEAEGAGEAQVEP